MKTYTICQKDLPVKSSKENLSCQTGTICRWEALTSKLKAKDPKDPTWLPCL